MELQHLQALRRPPSDVAEFLLICASCG